jgi:hypothetical protein
VFIAFNVKFQAYVACSVTWNLLWKDGILSWWALESTAFDEILYWEMSLK